MNQSNHFRRVLLQYQDLQTQWMEQQFEVLRQATETIKKKTENLGAVADAEIRKAVSVIESEKSMLQVSQTN